MDYVIKHGKVVTGSEVFPGDVGIREGKIHAIGKDLDGPSVERTYDAEGCFVLPGFVDSHTHMSLPVSGTVSSDDFFSGGRAAVYGGTTTIIDFTTPEPDQSLPSAIESRRREAEICPIDFSFHGTLYGFRTTEPKELRQAIELGVTSFKFFTAYGESNRRTPDGELLDAFAEIAKVGGTAMVHCENDEIISKRRKELKEKGKVAIEFHPVSRPDIAEATAVGKVIELAQKTGANLHLAHLTTKESMELLKRGRQKFDNLSGETCPQYLLLTEDQYEEENGFLYSATPPLRKEDDRKALWSALREGIIDSVGTDHCPFKTNQKDGFKNDFLNIPQGLPGVETMPSLLFTEGVKSGRFSLKRMVELISENPAKIFGLYPDKGSLRVGSDADIVVLDPDKEKELKPENLNMNTDFNPYEGKKTRGWPRFVFSGGKPVLKNGNFTGRKSGGNWINRSTKQTTQGAL